MTMGTKNKTIDPEKIHKLNTFLFYELTSVIRNRQLWRKRRVRNITPLDLYSYKLKTSYQFCLPSQLINPICNELNIEPQELPRPLHLYIPLGGFPKRVLTGFSIWDENGKSIPIVPRYEATDITFEHILMVRLQHVLTSNHRLNSLLPSIVNFKALLKAMIFQSPNEDALNQIKQPIIYDKTLSNIKAFLSESLQIFPDYETEIFNQNDKLVELVDTIDKFHGLGEGDNINPHGNKYNNYMLNPLLLAVDYFKVRLKEPIKYTPEDLATDFLYECEQYLLFLNNLLIASPNIKGIKPYNEIYELLEACNYFYYLFIPVNVNIDEDFIIKTESIIPVGGKYASRSRIKKFFSSIKASNISTLSFFKSEFKKFGSQGYQFSIGEEASSHIEVKCPSPAELHIEPKKCFLEINKEWHPVKYLFNYSSGESKGIQHYYTTKQLEEIVKLTGDRKGRMTLWVRYELNKITKYLYMIGFGIVFITGVIVPQDKFNNIPALLSIVAGLILSLRSKDAMVESYLKNRKGGMLLLVATIVIWQFYQYIDKYIVENVLKPCLFPVIHWLLECF